MPTIHQIFRDGTSVETKKPKTSKKRTKLFQIVKIIEVTLNEIVNIWQKIKLN